MSGSESILKKSSIPITPEPEATHIKIQAEPTNVKVQEEPLRFLFLIDAFLVSSFLALAIVLNGYIKPYTRGFHCDDESISLPYKEDTISSMVLYIGSLGVPLFVFTIVEVTYFFQLRRYPWAEDEVSPKVAFQRIKIPSVVINVLDNMGKLLGGVSVKLVITEAMKIMVGRLRPHFMDFCKPNWSLIQCTKVLKLGNNETFIQSLYVPNVPCLQKNTKKLLDSRKSFPSGHSSMALYTAVLLVLYLQYRLHSLRMPFLKVFFQTALLTLGIWCALSRISDHKHHWSDVLTGSLIGTVIAILQVFIVWKIPKSYLKIEQNLKRETFKNMEFFQ